MTCASPLASSCDGLLVPGGPAPSLPLPPSPSCSPAPLEGGTFLVMVPFCSVSPGLRTLPHHQGPCLFSAAPPVQGLWAPSTVLGTAWPKYEGWDPLWEHETTSFSMTQHNPSSPVKIRKGGRGEGETEEENGEETTDPNQSIIQRIQHNQREKTEGTEGSIKNNIDLRKPF